MTKWTHNNIPDQSGKVIIITGGNSGLGYESALALARKHATVVMASRNLTKADAAKSAIENKVPNATIDVIQLDLADLGSVQAFADAFNAKYDRLDVLMNNAGMMATPKSDTVDGFELQLGINHLGHFALTGMLLDKLAATEGSRVVNVSSLAASNGKMKFDDLMGERSYSRFEAYAQSKLANLLFTNELKTRLAAAKIGTLSVAAHPGGSNTNLANGMALPKPLMTLSNRVMGLVAQSAEMGALPQLYAAVAADVDSGEYYGPDGMGQLRGFPKRIAMPKHAYDTTDAQQLWSVSAELTKIDYLS